jgi:hypothetical protein
VETRTSYTGHMTTNPTESIGRYIAAAAKADRERLRNPQPVAANFEHRAQQIRYEDQRDRGDVG